MENYVLEIGLILVSKHLSSTSGSNFLITHLSLACFCGTYKANRTEPDQTPQNVASDHGLNCLFTECSLKVLKMKIPPNKPLKRKWTGPIAKRGKFDWT